MSFDWWSLPGPSRFLDRICEDLTEGKHVCIRMPSNSPGHLKIYLKERWLDHSYYEWRELNLQYFRSEADSPADLLYETYIPEADPGEIRNAANLARHPSFGKMIVWVEGLDSSVWPQWDEFLREYAEMSRNLPEEDRTRFVVLLDGPLSGLRPQPSLLLSVRDWQDTVDRLDMLLYCRQNASFPDAASSPLQGKLALELAAGLALWDRNLADYLLVRPLHELMDPAGLLAKFAETLGWGETVPASWSAGTMNRFENRNELHSAYLAAAGRWQDIRRRVWQAQLNVLFPIIEDLRHRLIAEFSDILTVPYVDDRGNRIEDLRDFELRHIWYQLRSLPLDSSLLGGIDNLRKLRNRLAHLDPIRGDELHLIEHVEKMRETLSSALPEMLSV